MILHHLRLLPNQHLDDLIVRREEQLDYVVPPPHALPCSVVTRREGEIWRELDSTLLTVSILLTQTKFIDNTFQINEAMSPMPSPWKQRYARLKPKAIEVFL